MFLLGGIDLSAGATLSLVNVTLASQPSDLFLSQIAMVFTGLAIGGLVGAFNGFFVAYMRLQAVVVTLASMFIILVQPFDHAQSRRPRARGPVQILHG